MSTSVQAVTLSSVADGSGAFTVSGVFWLTAPSNNVVPLPTFRSAVPGISAADLAVLRSGTSVEVPFTTAPQASGTSQATVDTLIGNMLTAAQTAVNNANPGLSTAVGRAFNGSTWAAYAGTVQALPVGDKPVLTYDMALAAALGVTTRVAAGRSTGYVATSATSPVKIRGTGYNPQGTNAQRSVVSNNAADTSAGTGAQTVLITYLDAAFVVHTETVTLNGTTAVNTVGTNIAYIESMVVATCGSGGTNAGTISIMTATAGGGSAWGSIAASDGATFWAHHYVPAGVTCYPVNVSGGSTVTSGRVVLVHTGNPSATNIPAQQVGGSYPHAGPGNEDHTFTVPIAVVGPDLIYLTETPNAATASVAFGTFEWIQA